MKNHVTRQQTSILVRQIDRKLISELHSLLWLWQCVTTWRLFLGDSSPSAWLVLILGVSTPRMIISNRMYYLNPVMHSTTLRRRMSKTFHVQVDPGPVSNLYRVQVPIPRAKFIFVVRVAGWSHLADAVCLSSPCSKTADRRGSYCVQESLQVC